MTNLLWIVVDCLRHDALSLNGYQRKTTAALDKRLPSDFAAFNDTCTQSSFTLCSATSMFSSQYPASHGTRQFNDRVPQSLQMLGDCLGSDGRETDVFAGMNFFDERWGLGDSFTSIHSLEEEKQKRECRQARANELVTKVRNWLPTAPDPFASVLWLFDTHTPWLGESFFTGENSKRDRYDSELRFVDQQLERLFNLLKSEDHYEDTMIILTSDHGDIFDEHYRFQGNRFVDTLVSAGPSMFARPFLGDGYLGHLSYPLYEELLHVPLYIKFPNEQYAGRVVEDQVELIDILPTILDVLDIPAASQSWHGRSLLQVLNEDDFGKEYVFAETMCNRAAGRYVVARGKTYKLLRIIPPENSLELVCNSPRSYLPRKLLNKRDHFVERTDESRGREDTLSEEYVEFGKQLDIWLQKVDATSQNRHQELSSEVRKELENLGYL